MTTIIKEKTIYQDEAYASKIKDIETKGEIYNNLSEEWWKNVTPEQKEIRKEEYKKLKQELRDICSKATEAKRKWKEAQSKVGKIIQPASEKYNEKSGNYYGEGFEYALLHPAEWFRKECEICLSYEEKSYFYKSYDLTCEYVKAQKEAIGYCAAMSLFKGKKLKNIFPNCRKPYVLYDTNIEDKILEINKRLCPVWQPKNKKD